MMHGTMNVKLGKEFEKIKKERAGKELTHVDKNGHS
jgi:hypothetical protein